ncbi:acetoacetate decarboxylase family protein [Streptomyces sp. NPDC057582]|uniref:acetoacetate decarboxylase family protein n=1 Tax=Streptomyces sp. NPDC057582 TaxID=3346174 RepID=UPI0036BCCE34
MLDGNGYKHAPLDADQAREDICRPTFMLKKLPGYTGEPRICELVRFQTEDITVKGARTGPARLQLFQHALAPMADLPVLEVLSASHVLTDLTLSPPEVVHDYSPGEVLAGHTKMRSHHERHFRRPPLGSGALEERHGRRGRGHRCLVGRSVPRQGAERHRQ